jgi:hypothetical protein
MRAISVRQPHRNSILGGGHSFAGVDQHPLANGGLELKRGPLAAVLNILAAVDWYQKGATALVFADPKPEPFMPVHGQTGLFWIRSP